MADTQINSTSGFFGGHFDRGIHRNSAGTLYFVTSANGKVKIYKGTSLPSASVDSAHEPSTSINVVSCIDSSDVIHIFYFSSSTQITHIKFYTTGGSADTYDGSPDAVFNCTAPDSSSHGMNCCSAAGVQHLVFLDDPGASNKFQVLYTNNASGWLTPETVSAISTSTYRWPSITPDNDGYLLIGYTLYSGAGALKVNRRTGVATYAGEVTLASAGTTYYLNNSLVVDPDTGDYYVFYCNSQTTKTILSCKKHVYADAFSTWSADMGPDTTNAYYLGYPASAIYNSKLYVTVPDNQNNKCVKFTNASGSWVNSDLGDAPAGAYSPRIRWSFANNPSYATYGFDYDYFSSNYGYYVNIPLTTPNLSGIMF